VSEKFVFYRRLDGDGVPMFFVKSQLQFGEIVSRVNERADHHEREVLAESDDADLLFKMRRLAKGEEE